MTRASLLFNIKIFSKTRETGNILWPLWSTASPGIIRGTLVLSEHSGVVKERSDQRQSYMIWTGLDWI